MGFDESLLAQLARHQGTNRSLRFARAPNGYHHAGKWCVRMHEISGQEWQWLLELDGVQSKCVRHMHGVMQRNGFVALRRSARSWSPRWSIARCSDSCLQFS